MLGMAPAHSEPGTTGEAGGQTVTPDGKALVRICDRWLPADALQAAD